MAFVLILIGIAFLYFGADGLVRGAADMALRFGLSPLVVGLTVVSFATSMPEAVSSFTAQFTGRGAIALGNILGSNIANVGLVLGLTALIRPLPVKPITWKRECPTMLLALLIFVLLLPLSSRWVGLVLLLLLALYVALQIYWGQLEAEEPRRNGGWLPMLMGLALLIAGGILLIEGSVSLARTFGISERVIGLTVVAIGSSLPELAATITASLRGHADIAIGNVVGSNVFNALFIGGGTSLIRPLHLTTTYDAGVMLLLSLALWLLLMRRSRMPRWQGTLLLGIYTIYLIGVVSFPSV
jgi:cation:H+ antiporter